MSQYTLTIKQLVENNIKIFDFYYELFDIRYKPKFEELFINYFYMEEIGFETAKMFKFNLENKLKLILPYYNKIYLSQALDQRILDNYDITEIYKREIEGTGGRELVGNRTDNLDTDSRNMYKDTPKTKVDINDYDTLTNLTKVLSNTHSQSDNTDKEKTSNNALEKYERTMKGNIGIQTDADAVMKYEESLRNVTLEIFEKELTNLFMGVF